MDPHPNSPQPSLFTPADGIKMAVEQMRQQLLDIGKRNRLTNAPVGKNRLKQLDIQDERADEVFKTLYRNNKKMTFDPAEKGGGDDGGTDESGPVFVPPDARGEGLAARHVDTKLQTRLTAEALQKRLLTLYREAHSLEEEQGVSVLFLAIGFLRWYESESSDTERFAPLVLLPVGLERTDARDRFRLGFRDQDLETNLSLQKLLDADFDLKLPDLPDGEGWLPTEYFQQVSQAISAKPRWCVQPHTMELGFYSFAKFLLYRDLDPDNKWGEGLGYDGNPLIEGLLVGGFESAASIFAPDENLDRRFPDPSDLKHILEADASQAQVIAAAREGKNLVVQGPPGTGKSQTITNIVAEVVAEGKRVLFVAEKRAALDVVHARLEKCGLGPLCLELHSHKASKQHVYADLKQTLELGEPRAVEERRYARVREVRDELNRITELLHAVDETTGETPYGVIGEIARLCESDCPNPGFRMPEAEAWGGAAFDERAAVVADLGQLTALLGSELVHPWRGTRKRLNRAEVSWVVQGIPEAEARLDALRDRVESAARWIGAASRTFAAVDDAVEQLDALAAMPKAVPGLLRSAALAEQPDAVVDICENIADLQRLKADLLRTLVESALELPWDEERLVIRQCGKSLSRWFNGSYRAAVARLRSVHRAELPKSYDARLDVLDRLLEYRRRQQKVFQHSHLGRDALKRHWREDETDAEGLLPALRWIAAQVQRLGSAERTRQQLDGLPAAADPEAAARDLRSVRDEWRVQWEGIVRRLDLDLAEAFGAEDFGAVALGDVQERLQVWRLQPGAIEDWFRLGAVGRRASELGLDEIRLRLGDGRLAPAQAEDMFRFARAQALWDRLLREHPELERVDGEQRSQLVEQFKDSDRKLQQLAAQEIALRHFKSLPVGSAGQIGIVRGEANKKTRHMPLRKLLDKAGEAVASIKPVFLMSPLSVAQYLRPGGLVFDLVLMDEASQVRPADGLGAIMRGRQVVVVGDQKQLPPTSFFDRQVAGGEDEGDYEEAEALQATQIEDMESILALCESRAMAGGMLRWHYRSKHPSLIQVSNQEFYEDKLIFPPSPAPVGQGLGLSFVKVDGTYDRGRKRNNPKEADAVADQVLAHARKHPDETLGVVALSVAQRDTILNKVEYLRSQFPELDAFCRESNEDPFFVKNLENVQGDERDAIFISIGYGKDEGGYMSQSFGPVSSEGGERRLNVLFTRSKARCRVFSSISHGDIRLDATKHIGPRVLKRFLKFAETGEIDIPVLSGGEADSPFEVAVAAALQSHGYRVAGQVGSAGFRIDLAVYDPDDEGRFLLAIECDGARYHSSSWARERDRLRQIVLEQKGWTFHRIWSTDWFYRRNAELQKLLDAIERARAGRAPRDVAARPPPAAAAESEPIVKRASPRQKPEPERHGYVEAEFEIPESRGAELHEVESSVLEGYVIRIVETEAPVHIEEVVRRLSRLWGYGRAGKRIRAAVREAVDEAVRRGRIRTAGSAAPQFLHRAHSPGSSDGVVVRDRSDVGSPKLRSPDMLPPSEIQAAIFQAVERNVALEGAECALEVARMFGFKSTRADLRARIQEQADQLVAQGRLQRNGAELRSAEAQPSCNDPRSSGNRFSGRPGRDAGDEAAPISSDRPDAAPSASTGALRH